MGKETTLFKTAEKKDRREVASFLRKLADRIEANNVTLKKGAEKLKLNIPKQVKFEVEVEKDVGKRKTEIELELEIKWTVEKSGKPKKKGTLKLG